MTNPTLLGFLTFALVMGGAAPASRASDTQPVPAEFNDRVNRYVDVHQAVATLVGLDAARPDPRERAQHEEGFAVALRQARRFARPGNIFTADVGEFFRSRLTAAAREARIDTAAVLDEIHGVPGDEGFKEPVTLEINGAIPPFPDYAALTPLLWRLPPLPAELEYRIFGTSLVLVDRRAGVIVDILDAALPAKNGYQQIPSRPAACDVHPEMPACWI
jgi:hypothetical protein